MMKLLLLCCVFVAALITPITSHGRMENPPHRGYLWRLPEYQWADPGHIADDTELHCGGERLTDPNINACGVCGDPITQPRPRYHEINGEFERGIIVRDYEAGQVIDVDIHWQALHEGWHEFRLCDYSRTGQETEQCFRANQLLFANGDVRLHDIDYAGITRVQVKLPAGLTCTRCVLLWEWSAANGQFYRNCADISIR